MTGGRDFVFVHDGSYLCVCIYVVYARCISSFVFLHALLRDEKQKRSPERLTASPSPPNSSPHSPHCRRLGSYAKTVQIFQVRINTCTRRAVIHACLKLYSGALVGLSSVDGTRSGKIGLGQQIVERIQVIKTIIVTRYAHCSKLMKYKYNTQ